MLIKNKTAHPIGLPYSDGRGGKMVHLLKPGQNDLAPAKWSAIREASPKSIGRMIDAGHIEEPDAGSIEAAPKVASLADFKPRDAERLIEETTDPALLMAWLDGEKRAKLIKALEARLELVTKPGSEGGQSGIPTVGENAGNNTGAPDLDGEG